MEKSFTDKVETIDDRGHKMRSPRGSVLMLDSVQVSSFLSQFFVLCFNDLSGYSIWWVA